MIKQLLQAKHFHPYIKALATLTAKSNHLQLFEQAQQQAWEQALLALEVNSADRPEVIVQAIQGRVTELGEMVNSIFNGFELDQILQILKPHLPAEALQCYALKPVVLRALLQKQLPQATLQYLGYATLDACLAKESLYELLAALRFSESAQWMQQFLQQYNTLSANDFERRPVQFITLAADKWWRLAEPFATKKKHHFSHLKEAGVVFWYPSPQRQQPQDHDLAVVMMLLHYIFEVHFYSQWFEQQAPTLPNFGQVFVATLQGDPELCLFDVHHLPIIQQYHLKQPNPNPCVFEPHVMPEALHWRKAMTTLFSVLRQHPQYHRVAFWETCYTVGEQISGQLVTLNVVDNVLSTTVQFNYHFREEMWNALFAHYYSDAILEGNIIRYFAAKQINLRQINLNDLTKHL